MLIHNYIFNFNVNIQKFQKVSCGNQSIRLRTTSNAKVTEWVTAINEAGLKPPEGWCHPHRFGSFAPQRGLTEDGSQAQWFIDGQAAFEAIASAIEIAKSEVNLLFYLLKAAQFSYLSVIFRAELVEWCFAICRFS